MSSGTGSRPTSRLSFCDAIFVALHLLRADFSRRGEKIGEVGKRGGGDSVPEDQRHTERATRTQDAKQRTLVEDFWKWDGDFKKVSLSRAARALALLSAETV